MNAAAHRIQNTQQLPGPVPFNTHFAPDYSSSAFSPYPVPRATLNSDYSAPNTPFLGVENQVDTTEFDSNTEPFTWPDLMANDAFSGIPAGYNNPFQSSENFGEDHDYESPIDRVPSRKQPSSNVPTSVPPPLQTQGV